jgi:hypothetical protein
LKPRLLSSSSSKLRSVTMEAAVCGSQRWQGTTAVGHGGGGWRQRPPSNEGHWTRLQQGGRDQCSLVASAHPRCVDHRAALDPPPCHLYTGTATFASNSMQVKI